ncbi:MAG: AarF/UbiB family protein [Victivallaceae bacterium]|nr:AarF/UbiB family protein [Victivallaceae bacterium]
MMLAISKISKISQAYRNLKRYRQIIQVLLKFGFGDILQRLKIDEYFDDLNLQWLGGKKHSQPVESLPLPARVRMACEELGPTFVKLCQVLSTRPDLIPQEYIEEFVKLQDRVPPFLYQDVSRIIQEELGDEPEKIFKEFSAEPIAAASIGQVHRATTHNGEMVVVKVQRPGIREVIEADIEIIGHLTKIAETHIEEFALINPSAIVNEFAAAINKELHYRVEAANARRFNEMAIHNRHVKAPAIFKQYSSDKVLTMEFIDGVRGTDFIKNKAEYLESYDLPLLARNGVTIILEQIFIHGFYHADPHPGNIFLLPGNVICFIDFGMMGRISMEERRYFARLLNSVLNCDDKKILEGCLRFTTSLNTPELDVLQKDIFTLIDENLYLPVDELELNKIFENLMDILKRHQLRLKPDLYLLIKTVMALELLGRELDPKLKIIDCLKPFVRRLRFMSLSPRYLFNKLALPAEDFLEVAGKMPMDAQAVLQQTREGKLKLQLQHLEIGHFGDKFLKASERISCALVLAALIVGSSIICHAQIAPLFFGVSLIGIIGFTMSAILALALLFAVFRRSR